MIRGAGGSTHVPTPESAPSRPSPRTPLGSRNLNRAAWTWPDASTARGPPLRWMGAVFSEPITVGPGRLGELGSHEGNEKGCPYPRVEAREGPMDSRHMDTLWAPDWRALRGQGDGPLNSFLLPLPLVEATSFEQSSPVDSELACLCCEPGA